MSLTVLNNVMTKSNNQAKSSGHGGSRPGSGRPSTGKSDHFACRISHETRAGLESQAGMSGLSVSRVAEQAIKLGLKEMQERQLSTPTRALAEAISELAERSGALFEFGKKEFPWNTDSFAFDAFTYALKLFLERLRPSNSELTKYLQDGDDVDDLDREMFASPETWAKRIFYNFWGELQGQQITDPKFLSLPVELPDEGALTGMGNMTREQNALLWERGDTRKIYSYAYILERIRRGLNLKRKGEEK
jgi:hypothetical protein